jgi:hypothetical protein
MSERISRDGVQERTPRNLQTRESSARSMEYTPPSTLPDPTPQPGWKFRWIATALLGAALPQNVSRKTREGWEPVKALDHPELMLAGDKNGNVELGGLILCKMPEELVDSRNNFTANKTHPKWSLWITTSCVKVTPVCHCLVKRNLQLPEASDLVMVLNNFLGV